MKAYFRKSDEVTGYTKEGKAMSASHDKRATPRATHAH